MTLATLPGQRLKAAREDSGLALADVAERLRLSTSIVRALEADDYERLPGAAFVKGYLRNYAKLVGLPADDIANLYQQIRDEEQPVEAVEVLQPVPQRRSGLIWLALAVGVIVVALLVFVGGDESAHDAVIDESTIERADEATSSVAPDADPGSEAPVESVDEQATSPEGTPTPVTEESEAAEVDAAPEQDLLSVAFLDVCWVKVVDAAGVEVFAGQKSAGSALRVEGQAPFRITLGNAAAVEEIRVNDDVIAVPAATPGRVVVVRAP